MLQDTFKKSFGVPLTEIMQKEYDFFKSFTTDQKQDLTKEEAKALAKYRFTSKEMIEKDIIFNVPLKNTTLSDKRSQIQNFDSCLNKFYDFAKNHNWIDQSTATYDFWRKDHVC